MNERLDTLQNFYAAFGLAAGTLLSVTVPVGERWRLIHVLASHDDINPHNLHFIITRNGTSMILHEVVAAATSIRIQMYAQTITRDSFILRSGDQLHVEAEAMGAGKKLYIQCIYEARIGEVA